MTQHASMMQLDVLPLAHAPLTSLAATRAPLGLTALSSLTQLSSLKGATALPDLVSQHASLMQLNVLPLAYAPLTSPAATRFAAARLNTLPQLSSPTQLCSLLKLDRPGHHDTLQLGATPLAKCPR